MGDTARYNHMQLLLEGY